MLVSAVAAGQDRAGATSRPRSTRCGRLNRAASEVLVGAGIVGATDVTGFGLLGHGLEMARASGTRFVFEAAGLPALDGALELAAAGVETGGAAHNRRFVRPSLAIAEGVSPELVTLAHDPQTSGGLLAAVPADQVDAVERASRRRASSTGGLAGSKPANQPSSWPDWAAPMEIAPGIRRLGSGKINVYLIEEAGAITIVDAGLPGYFGDLQAELTAMGRSLDDVRAVLLTHAHTDHIGFAERIRRERGVPIRVHEADAALARGEVKQHNEGGGKTRLVPAMSFLLYGLRKGFIGLKHVTEVSTFGDGATLDVPGSPRVIHVPGHTAGSAALQLPDRDAILVGDAFVTLNVMSGSRGPQLFRNFNADNRQAFESLRRFDDIEASLVLAGHGEPFRGGIAEAVRLVRAGWSPA